MREEIMTSRERFNAVMNFKKPEGRLPMVEWAAWWNMTTDGWKKSGMPDLGFSESLQYFDLDELRAVHVHTRWKDLPCMIETEDDYEQCRGCLLQDDAIELMKTHLNEIKPLHDRGEIILRIWIDGYFWFPRTLLGIEPHMYAFYDKPELMHRLNGDLADFNEKAMNECMKILKPDFVGYAEDMSYNHGPMLSKKLFDEFLLPYYKRVNPIITAAGVPVMVDTDGDVTEMIPWLAEAGIDGVYPLERQAGVDINLIRKLYPNFLMLGGFDKMVMANGEDAIRGEFERILPVMKSGGYIPSVDHQTPPHVTLDDYKLYAKLFHEYAVLAAK